MRTTAMPCFGPSANRCTTSIRSRAPAAEAKDVLHRHPRATELDRQREREIQQQRERYLAAAGDAGAELVELRRLLRVDGVEFRLGHGSSSREDGSGAADRDSSTRTAN